MILRRFCRFLASRYGVISISATAAAVLIVILVVGVGAQDRAGVPAFKGALQSFKHAEPPRPAPGIGFTDTAEKPLSLADFKGKVVLLNYWATWCAPCVEEMPSLERLHSRLGGPDFAVLAISVDRQGLSIVEPFLQRIGLKQLPIYLDRSGASMRAFAVRGLPTTMLIDRDGNDVGRLEGMADWDSPAAEALIRHYIGGGASPQKKAELRPD
jgi:thiol-disulfide isomerase/thioredoxin